MIRFFVARWERAVGLQDHPEPQPDLVERLLFALDRAGRPNTPVGVVTGGGKPFLGRGRGGLLLASPELGALLTDDELAALVRFELVVPPGVGGVQARFRAYLDEGGAPLPYIGARAKLYGAAYGNAVPPRAREHMQLLARVGGVTPEQLAVAVAEGGARG